MHLHKFPTLLVSLLLLASIGSFATDFGVELANTAGIEKLTKVEFFTDHKATLWATIPFNNENTHSLALEGSLYAKKPAGIQNLDYYVDLDLFRLSFTPQQSPSGKIMVNAGRFPVADMTGKILNQGLDGFEILGIKSFGNFSFFAGYTGLLNSRQGKNLMTPEDNEDTISDDIYAFGAKRAVVKATMQLLNLVAGADIIVEVLGQYDLREMINSDDSSTVHTAYGTLALTGPINSSTFYTVSGTFQTGILDSDTTYSEHAIMGLARLDFFPISEANIFAEVLYTSGEDGFFSHLLPITYQKAGTLYASGYSNIMQGSAGVYYNPMDLLNLDLVAAFFMYPKKPEGADGLYSATEVNAGATFKPMSDLKLRLSGALLFPNDEDMTYQAELTVVLAL